MSGSMSGVWKQGHGRTSEAPPDERGGNGYVRPATTAPHLDSTKTRSALIEHTVSGFAPKTDVPMRASGVEIGHRDVILACKNGGQDHTL